MRQGVQQRRRAAWMDPETSAATNSEGTLFSSPPCSGISLGHGLALMATQVLGLASI